MLKKMEEMGVKTKSWLREADLTWNFNRYEIEATDSWEVLFYNIC